MNRHLTFKIIVASIFFTFISCSKKDSDDPIPQETEITVSTADFSKTMDENPNNGQIIGTISGSTNEGTVSFSLIEETPTGALYIDAATGELKVADDSLFDFETNPTITGTVKVTSGAVSKNASIIINLNDVGDIYEGDVILKTQEEVNLFGANNYTQINGLLLIGHPDENGTTDITDLSPLHSIRIINNSFQIKNNTLLTTTEGLNVEFILGQLAISKNPSLESIKGFNTINSIAGVFLFENNVLSDLSGLNQIANIDYNFSITLCPLITDLEWLRNLTTIGNGFSISNCNSLRNLDGLSNLTNFTDEYGSIRFSFNDALENIDGLQNLNASLIDLTINNNPSLQNINGLASIDVFQSLNILNNESLQNLNGLGTITYVSIQINIKYNNSLTNLEGLDNLGRSSGSFIVQGNENLVNVNGLNGLYDIQSIKFYNNTNLIDFCTLQNLLITDTNCYFDSIDNAYNPTKQDIIDGNCSL